MRNVALGFLLLFCATVSQFAQADNPAPGRPFAPPDGVTAGNQLRAFLKSLDLGAFAKAYAAECRDEGEMCKTNADCCSGLECSGDPQTTCRPAE
jgi:hypothetical protein